MSMKNDMFKCHYFDGILDLQNCMDVLKSEPGPCSGTCQMSSDDGNQVVGIKVEDVTDMKDEEDPWPATSTGIETELAVSCLCVCVCVCLCISSVVHIAQISRISCPLMCFLSA